MWCHSLVQKRMIILFKILYADDSKRGVQTMWAILDIYTSVNTPTTRRKIKLVQFYC